jgi:hypothetical protein
MGFSGVVSAADEPNRAPMTSFPRNGAATMHMPCGVFRQMGREAIDYNQKLIIRFARFV